MANLQQKLTKIVEPVIVNMGCEFVGLRYLPQGKYALLRIYIDKNGGIQLDDCSAVSHQISGVLDVEDIISGQYNLEVSSPGIDYPLFVLSHYQRFIDEKVIIKFATKIDDRRKIVGTIKKVVGETIHISTDERNWILTIDQIDNAMIVADI